MRKIIFILILLSVYGCNIQRKTYCERKAEKVARILKDCPGIIDTTTIHDTVTIRDTFNVHIPARIDSSHIDSLLALYCDAVDTTGEIKPDSQNKAAVIKHLIYLECSPEKVIGEGQRTIIHGKDTVIVKFKGTKDGLNLSIVDIKKQVNITKTIVPPCPPCKVTFWHKVKEDGIFWLIIALFFFLLGLFKR